MLVKQVGERLGTLPGLRLVRMDRSLVKEATRLAAEFGLRGADAYYLAVADRLRLPLVTLDQDQGRRAAGWIAVNFLQ